MEKPVVRETYLDIIKGIAMLLVVMQHVGGGLNEGMTFLCKVDVPLFFLVSGFLAYKPHIDYKESLFKKIIHIAVPFVLASLFAIFYYGLSLKDYVFDIGKRGYWFLLCLFIMFVLYYVIHGLETLFKWGGYWVVVTLTMELLLLACSKYAPEEIDNVVGLSYLSRYFPCFMLGVVLKRHSVRQIGKMMGTLLLVMTCIAFTYHGSSKNVSFLLHVMGYVCSSALMFYFIRCTEMKMPRCVRNMLALFGKNSLAIYIIHFYFVVHLTSSTGYFVIDFALSLCVALVIILLSLMLQRIFLKMTYLYKVL